MRNFGIILLISALLDGINVLLPLLKIQRHTKKFVFLFSIDIAFFVGTTCVFWWGMVSCIERMVIIIITINPQLLLLVTIVVVKNFITSYVFSNNDDDEYTHFEHASAQQPYAYLQAQPKI
ncbi:hypothetical protein OUZ56_032093 [Daphnia magna]|uniref:Uncharacterized protein n=1 Tax=Daphnia magna TaxID=35525 RepID=A0ABQ9ZWH8_9CRUS|nr:hypothetical protein OUZ56_032093 [Daphnia magna]